MASLSPKRENRSLGSRLIIISAPSGAGKTTLCDMLLKDFPQIMLSISATTRPKRPYEADSVHYFFLKAEDFQRKIDNHQFAEWAKVHGHLYGTPKTAIDQWLQQGRHVLFDIDVQGAMSLLKSYGEKVLLVFIKPPSMEVLQKRLIDRKGDSAPSIEKRLENAYNEIEWSKSFDYQITNDHLDKAYQELKEIIKKECL